MENIWLIRHGESLGNVDKTVYRKMGDQDVPLTERGHEQAREAAQFLVGHLTDVFQPVPPAEFVNGIMIAPDGTRHAPSGWIHRMQGLRLRVWSSPYRRARETTEHITAALLRNVVHMPPTVMGNTSSFQWPMLADAPQLGHPDPYVPAWHRESIRLAEQQFGLLNGIADGNVADHYPDVHEDYERAGKFYARPPGGESRYDVAIRVHQQFGTFHRDAERHGIRNIIVVCHGTTLRCFLMEWLHRSPEWCMAEPNPKNCAIRRISKNPDGGYTDHGYVWEGAP